MSTMSSTLEEFIELTCEKVDALTAHSFIAKSQNAYLKQQKEELQQDQAIIICDFAENFQYVVQDEVQGYHWNKKYCTLHPVSIYYRTESGSLETDSLCALSDDIQHDTPFVHKCIEFAVNHIKSAHPEIKHIKYFTDGCGGQYKNFKNFINLCEHEADFGLTAEWNFFATSHGKGPCDGIGGTVKRLACNESLRRTSAADHIISIDRMFEFCKTIQNVKFCLIRSAEMDDVRKAQNKLFERGSTVPGTQSYHQFTPVDRNTVSFKRISSDIHTIGTYCFRPSAESHQRPATMVDLRLGNYVAAIYDQDWYVGLVEEVDEERKECQLNFMHPKNPTGNVMWPSRADRCLTPIEQVLAVIEVPGSSSKSARTYNIKENELEIISKLFNDYINRK
jgi:hypothetical protein